MKKLILFYLGLICLLTGCQENKNTIKQHTIFHVEKKIATQQLHYTGIIAPVIHSVIVSPVDGTVVKKYLAYGSLVEKGQLIFELSSTKFFADYKDALLAYIKAKNDFTNNQTMYNEADFLIKHELISTDDYKAKASTFYASQLALAQAKDSLNNLINEIHQSLPDLENLNISNIHDVMQTINARAQENIKISASQSGLLLAANKSDQDLAKIQNGQAVKQGEALAVIGQASALQINIKVDELTVNQIQIGQRATITGPAFPGLTLQGRIETIDRQGENTSGSPGFAVVIHIPKLSRAEQAHIQIGMSAKVSLEVEQAPKILIPLAAIREENNQLYVQKVRSDKQRDKIMIETGSTTLQDVEVISGLNTGDDICVPYPA